VRLWPALALFLALLLSNYVINGLPTVPDSWVHLDYASTIIRTGYLFGNSTNPWSSSYNYQWPTVNLLLALSQLVMGLSPMHSFVVITITAALSVVPYALFVRRLCDDSVAALSSLLFASLSVKILVDSSVMKETAAQYPFYVFLLVLAMVRGSVDLRGALLLVLVFLSLLFSHHFTLLMAMVFSLAMVMGELLSRYVGGASLGSSLLTLAMLAAFLAVTYAWYSLYLGATSVMALLDVNTVVIPMLFFVLLADYSVMSIRARVIIYGALLSLALALIIAYSVGLIKPYVLQGYSDYLVVSTVPQALPIVLSVGYLLLRRRDPALSSITMASLSIITYVILMSPSPFEYLLLAKSLDFAMPMLLAPAVIVSGRLRRIVLPLVMVTTPLFAMLTLYTYSLPTSSTLTVYESRDYYAIRDLASLAGASRINAPTDIGSMVSYVMGTNPADPVSALLRGELPPGLSIIRERNIVVGFLYGGGYGVVNVPTDYLKGVLSNYDLVYGSNSVVAYLNG